ncbi:MAG: DNA polymerase III subunit delta [Chloroflexi bacterium]|nr:DNA polymerase III subunit delta [Chloroflexota bacterium]
MFLLIGEDPYRARLRLAELVASLVAGAPTEDSAIARWPSPSLGMTLGVTRHDARSDSVDAIAMSGRSQGLFDAPDERRAVVVENAEALTDTSFIAELPPESALVLVTTERVPAGRRRPRAKTEAAAPADLVGAVEAAGGRVERIGRLFPDQVPAWISARAALANVTLQPAAVTELASAVGTDTDRLEQELAKLSTYAKGETVTVGAVRALVPGAIETEVFDLTRAVVRRDPRSAVALLERLLGEGQAPQQILALLLWQFRVVLFASAMKTEADGERMARAIRSSAAAIGRWRAEARRLSRSDVIRAYEALYATDLAIKQGRTDPETALMLCVLDLCGVANADPRELVVGEPPRR